MKILMVLGLVVCVASADPRYAKILSYNAFSFDPTIATVSYELIGSTFFNYNLTVLNRFPSKLLCSMLVKRQLKTGTKTILSFGNVNFCNVRNFLEKDTIMSSLLASIFQPTFSGKCPLEEGFYFIKDAFFNADLVNILLPNGTYHLFIDTSVVDDGISRFLNAYLLFRKYVIFMDFSRTIFDTQSIAMQYSIVNSTFLNINLTIMKVYNSEMLCTLRMKRLVKGKIQTIFRWKQIDYCKLMAVYEKDVILHLILSRIIQTTYVHSCPLKVGFYFIRNANIDNNVIRMFLPTGDYSLMIDVSYVGDGIVRMIAAQLKFLIV